MTDSTNFSTKEIVIMINDKLDSFMERQDEKDEKLEGRVSTIEKWKSARIAVSNWLAAIGSILGAGAVTVILWLIFGEKID